MITTPDAPAVPFGLIKGRNKVDATVTLVSPTSAVVEAGTQESPVTINGVPHRVRAWVARDDVRDWHVAHVTMYRTDRDFGLGDASQAARVFVYATVVDAVEHVARHGMAQAEARQAVSDWRRAQRVQAEAQQALHDAYAAQQAAWERVVALGAHES